MTSGSELAWQRVKFPRADRHGSAAMVKTRIIIILSIPPPNRTWAFNPLLYSDKLYAYLSLARGVNN